MGEENLDTSEKLTVLGFVMDDIKKMKSQQWYITNYVVLIYVGLAGFYKYMGSPNCPYRFVLLFIAILVLFLGVEMINETQKSLQDYRGRFKRIMADLPTKILEGYWFDNDDKIKNFLKKYDSYWKGWRIFLSFIIVQLLSFSFFVVFLSYYVFPFP